MLKIATWNVNSIKVRLPHVLSWLKEHQPDVIGLQELKLASEFFPHAELAELGYHSVANGQKTYNGVAIISRQKPDDAIHAFPSLEDPQRRVLAVTIQGIRMINLYVPNGENLTSAKYQYKLNWLEHLQEFLAAERTKYPKLIILGDFNIAPEDIDVHDANAWRDQVLCSAPERTAFQNLLRAELVDCFRFKNPNEQHFSWWDYRLNAFKRNIGLRIDHILASHTLVNQCENCYIDKASRALERPSDHAPVVAEFNII